MVRNLVGAVFLGALGIGIFTQNVAEARVITDWEASKLTLDALTATPVYHRPVMHRFASRSRMAFGRHHAATLRTVSYRYHARASVAVIHHHSRHRT